VAVRLNKYLADRGVGARRKCDKLIEEGRVSVNGRVVSEVGSKVEEGDRVSVNGRPLGGKERTVYFVLNKPVGVITTLDDPEGRRTIRDLLPRGARVYPVGRLDADTSGLLLLTNDGELAHKLMHPRYGVPKVYRVRLNQEPRADQLRRLATGVRFDPLHKDMVSGPARVRRIDPGFDAIMIEIIIHEGRFRQVRRMCEAVGLEVTGLHRVGYGPLSLGPLARGMFRELSEEEVARLKAVSARAGGSGRAHRGAGAESEHSDRKLERAATSARPAKPERPAATTRPARPRPAAPIADDDEAVIEETWLPGGGFLEPEAPDSDDESDLAPSDDAPATAWPARPTGRRGDAAWQAEHGGRPAPSRRAVRAERPRPATARPERGRAAPRAQRSRAAAPRRDGFAAKRDPFARGDRARGGAPRGERPRRGATVSRTSTPRGEGFGPRGGGRTGRPSPTPRPGSGGPRDRGRTGRPGPAPRPGSGGPRDRARGGPRGRPARAEGRPVGNSTRRAAPRGRVRPSGGPVRNRRPAPTRGPGATLRQRGKKSSRRKER
jgi:23S rRNA pseudouridine2605 synthase